MKDKINERLILLATAQECMMDVTDMMDQWDSSQLITEKSAFESVNVTDTILNMSKEGNRLVSQLQEYCNEIAVGRSADQYLKMTALLEETKNLFQNIMDASALSNEISHRIEGEVAFQREMEEGLKCHLTHVCDSLDSAVACAEFTMAEILN